MDHRVSLTAMFTKIMTPKDLARRVLNGRICKHLQFNTGRLCGRVFGNCQPLTDKGSWLQARYRPECLRNS